MGIKIGVFPASAAANLPRLLDALGAAFGVEFEGRAPGQFNQLRAAIVFDSGRPEDVTQLAARGIPCYVAGHSNPAADSKTKPVIFGSAETLPRCLRGQSLPDTDARCFGQIAIGPKDSVLAEVDGKPAWIRRLGETAVTHWAAAGPVELEPAEPLRRRMEPGRFIGLLPLIQFLREVTVQNPSPELRASFIIDDPNLHWPSYGTVDYRRLASHATRDNYHVAMAMIPLDTWWTHRGAVDIFRAHHARLSLLMHGNNHTHHELDIDDPARCLSVAAEALRRIVRFERITGVEVSRVMAAPHGRCSEAMCHALLLLGYEGLCISRPEPWNWTSESEQPLTGWDMTNCVAGGLPAIPRLFLTRFREDAVLRAFLGNPIIFHLHSEDLSPDFALFGEVAGFINALGNTRWLPLAEIARTNYTGATANSALEVRLHSRRVEISAPEDVRTLTVRAPHALLSDGGQRIQVGDREATPTECAGEMRTEPVSVVPGQRLTIRVIHPQAVSAGEVSPPPFRLWHVARRVLTEGRDRCRPLLQRIFSGETK